MSVPPSTPLAPTPYRSIEALLDLVVPPNRAPCLTLLARLRAASARAPGSTHNHQAWPGGYLDHVAEVLNLGVILHATLDAQRPGVAGVRVGDVILVLFLHDLEKPAKYARGDQAVPMADKGARAAYRWAAIDAAGIALTAEQRAALEYVEGEGDAYSQRERRMSPLAALCHACDVLSARYWHDFPRAGVDPWPGAARSQPFG
jgi:hypothetical protein